MECFIICFIIFQNIYKTNNNFKYIKKLNIKFKICF